MDLQEWRAKRAGGRITVYGRWVGDRTNEVKIVGVDKIEPGRGAGRGYVVATDKNGDTHRLFV